MPKQPSGRCRSRRFYNNQFTVSCDVDIESDVEETCCSNKEVWLPDTVSSTSAKKLLAMPLMEETSESSGESITGYRLMDMEILSATFSLLTCPDCAQFTLMLMENHLHRKGCTSCLHLICKTCQWLNKFCCSKKKTQGFQVN